MPPRPVLKSHCRAIREHLELAGWRIGPGEELAVIASYRRRPTIAAAQEHEQTLAAAEEKYFRFRAMRQGNALPARTARKKPQ